MARSHDIPIHTPVDGQEADAVSAGIISSPGVGCKDSMPTLYSTIPYLELSCGHWIIVTTRECLHQHHQHHHHLQSKFSFHYLPCIKSINTHNIFPPGTFHSSSPAFCTPTTSTWGNACDLSLPRQQNHTQFETLHIETSRRGGPHDVRC